MERRKGGVIKIAFWRLICFVPLKLILQVVLNFLAKACHFKESSIINYKIFQKSTTLLMELLSTKCCKVPLCDEILVSETLKHSRLEWHHVQEVQLYLGYIK